MNWRPIGFLLVLAACSEQAPVNPPTKTNYAGVAVNDDAFAPAEVTIRAGDHVTWVWEGSKLHGLQFYGSPTATVKPQGKGGLYDRAFDTPGTYLYYCPIHGGGVGWASRGCRDGSS